ncbi:iron-containing alcohol dehydrogenase [Candidatus Gracilibacteria bacterium]|nr:iron-containing alcohol dehydrogenase [Candidatus Gracilibacteria bacterium]
MNTNTLFGVQIPTAIEFGVGAAAKVGERARQHGIRNAFLVTDRGLAQSAAVQSALETLAAAGVATTLYSDVKADPTSEAIQRAAQAYRAPRPTAW